MRSAVRFFAVAALLVVAALDRADARSGPEARPKSNGEIVEFDDDLAMGTIVIRTAEKRLYYVLGDGQAVRYPIAVGEPRFQWSGEVWVSSKQQNPIWRPTARMRRENPGLPISVGPGPRNPLGPRAIYLGWGEYRIHGTNAPQTIGSAASSGCFRMHNTDAIDLFDRVHIGAPVIVQ
ncbi:MAG TPA: L,D-transpeptidase [Xanthobacteraceae bacterium]|jgi:lipoprotein-anchoring transpeptidase ErfK/SrfK